MVFTMTCPSRLESAASSEIYWSSGTNIVLLKPGNCKSRFFLFFYFIIFLAFIEYKNRSDYLFSLRIEKHWKERLNQASLNNQAPGMGFEPMRTLRSTGSQGPRVNHSATSALNKSTFYFARSLNVYRTEQKNSRLFTWFSSITGLIGGV